MDRSGLGGNYHTQKMKHVQLPPAHSDAYVASSNGILATSGIWSKTYPDPGISYKTIVDFLDIARILPKDQGPAPSAPRKKTTTDRTIETKSDYDCVIASPSKESPASSTINKATEWSQTPSTPLELPLPLERSMLSRLHFPPRHMKPAPRRWRQTGFLGRASATMSTSTFSIPGSDLRVNSTPDLTQDDLLSFPAFNIWFATLQKSLARQQSPSHEFHHDPYILRSIDIQSIDRFGGGRLGFVKLRADVSNAGGEKLPGSIFLRGGSVGMLLILQPDDIPASEERGKMAILTIQPRIPAGSLAFPEIPAGMLDDSGTFAGGAAKEIEEETGLSVQQNELTDMTALALQSLHESADGETLQKAVYPSAGGSDEFIPLFLCQKRMPRREIEELQGKLTGLRDHGEKITLKVVPLENLWKEGLRDGKTLAAWALYKGLQQEGLI